MGTSTTWLMVRLWRISKSELPRSARMGRGIQLCASPWLLAAGDRVRFVPVSTEECRAIEAAARSADFDPMQWLDSAPTPAENAA